MKLCILGTYMALNHIIVHIYIMLTQTKLKAEHTVVALLSRVDCSG